MNVMVVCMDTLRWDALGCYGSDWVKTPCIDAFAESAALCSGAYCASFPTVPMRVDAYTGAVNWPRYGWRGPDPEQPKLPQLLRDAGVYTGLVLDTANNVHGPKLHEFYDEYHLIRKEVGDGITPDDIVTPVPEEYFRQFARGYRRDRSNWAHYRNESDWFVSRTMRRACEWLEEHSARDAWFLWVDTFEIHEDYMPPSYYVGLYESGYNGLDYTYPNYGYSDMYAPEELHHLRSCYAGEVTLTDRWVGHLLRQIEVMGLLEDTAVILLSDHGMYLGEHGRCGKHTVDADDAWPLYDTVARIPLIVRSPEGRARQIDGLVQPADLLPTICDLMDAPCPPTLGQSLVPALSSGVHAAHERVYTTFNGKATGMPSHVTVTTPTHTAIIPRLPREPELYDRRSDPEQLTDVAAAHPELVAQLHGDLIDFMREQGAEEAYVTEYLR